MNLIELRKISDEVIKMYLNGLSAYKIGKILGTHDANVGTVLRENNIPLRDKRDNRRYTYNENYFDNIDTQNKAYFLGLLYSDGCNDKKYNRITLTLEKSDGYILEKLRQDIESNKPLSNNKNTCYKNTKPSQSLILKGEYICNKLEELGVVPAKSLILEWPTFLREDLYSHFIRGYFDGDGCIQGKAYVAEIQITSSTLFCKGMEKYLNSVNILTKVTPEDNPLTSSLYIRSWKTDNDKKFLQYMYKDANFYLERKYKIAKKYIT